MIKVHILHTYANFLKEYSVSLVQRVELDNSLLALLLLSGASQEPGPPGLESLLPLPDSLVCRLTGLVTGPPAGDPSAEVLRNVAKEDVLLIKSIEPRKLSFLYISMSYFKENKEIKQI